MSSSTLAAAASIRSSVATPAAAARTAADSATMGRSAEAALQGLASSSAARMPLSRARRCPPAVPAGGVRCPGGIRVLRWRQKRRARKLTTACLAVSARSGALAEVPEIRVLPGTAMIAAHSFAARKADCRRRPRHASTSSSAWTLTSFYAWPLLVTPPM